MAKAMELRPPRKRPDPAGTAVGRAPPEDPGSTPGGAPGDGPVVGVVRQPEKETREMPETTLELGVDFTADKRR